MNELSYELLIVANLGLIILNFMIGADILIASRLIKLFKKGLIQPSEKGYFELKYKMNAYVLVGSITLAFITLLGYTSIEEIKLRSSNEILKEAKISRNLIDSIYHYELAKIDSKYHQTYELMVKDYNKMKEIMGVISDMNKKINYNAIYVYNSTLLKSETASLANLSIKNFKFKIPPKVFIQNVGGKDVELISVSETEIIVKIPTFTEDSIQINMLLFEK